MTSTETRMDMESKMPVETLAGSEGMSKVAPGLQQKNLGGDTLQLQGVGFGSNVPIQLAGKDVEGKNVKWLKGCVWKALQDAGVELEKDSELHLYHVFPHFLSDEKLFTGEGGTVYWLLWQPSQDSLAFNIKIQMPDGSPFVSSVRASDTIHDLLQRIETERQIPARDEHLFFHNSHALGGSLTMKAMRIPVDGVFRCSKIQHGNKK